MSVPRKRALILRGSGVSYALCESQEAHLSRPPALRQPKPDSAAPTLVFLTGYVSAARICPPNPLLWLLGLITRSRRARGALAPALQAEPTRPARDVRRARHRVQLRGRPGLGSQAHSG